LTRQEGNLHSEIAERQCCGPSVDPFLLDVLLGSKGLDEGPWVVITGLSHGGDIKDPKMVPAFR